MWLAKDDKCARCGSIHVSVECQKCKTVAWCSKPCLKADKQHRKKLCAALANARPRDSPGAEGEMPPVPPGEDQEFADLTLEIIRHDNVSALEATSADLQAVFGKGFTLLHVAAIGGSVKCARFLIQNGADLEHVNEDGLTPQQQAEQSALAHAPSRTESVPPPAPGPNARTVEHFQSIVAMIKERRQLGLHVQAPYTIRKPITLDSQHFLSHSLTCLLEKLPV